MSTISHAEPEPYRRLSCRRWLALFALGLAVSLMASVWVSAPGYMDADYYYATAGELAEGRGFTEPFLWNYLDDPSGLPHPSHLYWMPLPSLLAAAPMHILGSGFRAAQIPFILLTACLPLLAARLALHLGLDERQSWLAGLLACFPGFYLPYFVTSETFSLFAVVGSLAMWAMAAAIHNSRAPLWLAAGALSGLAHLTRADGVLLMAPALLAIWLGGNKRVRNTLLVVGGYGLIMAPWWARNFALFGSLFPPGAGRALWLVTYDELFSYPSSILTPQRWLSAGFAALLQARLQALTSNLQSLLAVNGIVFLAPLVIVGIVRAWKRWLVRLAVIYLAILFVLMTFVLPQVGERGGFFHSSAALMPVFWALSAYGLDAVVAWLGARRRWDAAKARAFFGSAAVLFAAALTAFLYWGRVVGSGFSRPAWAASAKSYEELGDRLRDLDAEVRGVAVNNPPGFYAATGIQAIVIPNGPPDTLQQVVERYGVEWIILEENHPQELGDLYARPHDSTWLVMVEEVVAADGSTAYLMQVGSSEGLP